ncbi:MAG TPA: hypothetical protein VMZ71_02635 [Gemmataceae bacterium]|nr:hypothetical protein [Gemmataceae bacterium]
MEQTKRGEADRERENEVMAGEPTGDAKKAAADAAVGTTTKDKSVEPAKDTQQSDKRS